MVAAYWLIVMKINELLIGCHIYILYINDYIYRIFIFNI